LSFSPDVSASSVALSFSSRPAFSAWSRTLLGASGAAFLVPSACWYFWSTMLSLSVNVVSLMIRIECGCDGALSHSLDALAYVLRTARQTVWREPFGFCLLRDICEGVASGSPVA